MTSHFSGLDSKPETQLSEKTIWHLQNMRRANAAIIGCIELLNEDSCNEGCSAMNPGVFIRLEVHQKMGLHFAIETCAREIATTFDDHLDNLGVGFLDEICPEVTEEARAESEYHNGKITLTEFERRTSGKDPIHEAKNIIFAYHETHTKEEFAELVERLKSIQAENKAPEVAH